MELVYLWVEDYKNIKNQGFNFSPRFECEFKTEYDENGKLKDNCELVINEKKDYVSIFPNNINITAIVGENGSGKSSIITEIINNIIFNTKTEYQRKAPLICFLNDNKDEIYIYSNLIKDISKVISTFEFKITHLNNENIPIEIDKEYKSPEYASMMKISKKFKDEYYRSFFYLYNNSLEKDSNYHHTYEYNEELLFFSEINKSDNIINLENETEKTYTYLITLLFNQNRIPKSIENFFVPTRLFLDREIFISYFKGTYENEEMPYHKFLTKNPTFKDTVKLETLLYLRYFIAKFKVIHHDEMKEEIEIYFENKNIINEYQNIYDDLILSLPKFIANIKSTKESIRRDDNKSNDIKELNELEKILLLLSSIDKLIYLIKNADNNTNDPDYEIDINLLSDENDENIHFLKEMPSYLKIDFATKTRIKFDELSSGERNLLKLMFSIENIIQKRKDKTDSLYILLDEIETTFHPDWQKRILNWLIGFIKHYDMKFNIIVASHSPFILSDLPKENVIFLKNGKQEHPFKKDEQTFGANIHTLLSHGFFMKDGLMGEFAKEKINEVIKLLNSKRKLSKKNQKFCENIISIIGEPILQKTLEHQLNEKLNPNETELQKLQREEEEIKAKIAKLTGKNNEKD